MLPPAERSLVRRDPDLPGLALLLDSERLTRWLGGLLGRPVTVTRRHLRYKPGVSCVLHVDAGGQPLLVEATARSEAAKHAKTLERSAGAIIGTDPTRQVLAGTPAADRDLPGLALLTDPSARERLLRRVLPDGPAVDPWTEPVLLRYKPHRRWVGVLTARGGGKVLLRVQRPEAAQAAAQALTALSAMSARSSVGPRTPRLLGRHLRRGVLAVEYLPGTPAQEVPAEQLEPLGRALAALHRQPDPALPATSGAVEVEQVQAAADQLGVLLPDLPDRATRLADRIATTLTGLEAPRTCVHGDFSADQAVIGPDGEPALIDLDTARLGDPAADLGCAAAALLRDRLLGRLTEADRQRRLAALHQGYTAAGGPARPEGVRVHTAAHLLRLTAEPFRLGQSPQWPELAAALLDRAEELAAEPAGAST